jgi:hypothetical protein
MRKITTSRYFSGSLRISRLTEINDHSPDHRIFGAAVGCAARTRSVTRSRLMASRPCLMFSQMFVIGMFGDCGQPGKQFALTPGSGEKTKRPEKRSLGSVLRTKARPRRARTETREHGRRCHGRFFKRVPIRTSFRFSLFVFRGCSKSRQTVIVSTAIYREVTR